MRNQRGVTLVELLVVIVIMGAIFVPISMMVNYSLKTEREVSTKNDVQREARLIMEYVTQKMRNSNVDWDKYDSDSKKNQSKKLIFMDKSGLQIELLDYEQKNGSKGIMKKDSAVLSENIKEFTVTITTTNLVNIKLIIEKLGFEFELQSSFIHPNIRS